MYKNISYKQYALAYVVTAITLVFGGELVGINQQPQFSYEHKTEIAYNDEKGFPLPSAIEQFALVQNKYLNYFSAIILPYKLLTKIVIDVLEE